MNVIAPVVAHDPQGAIRAICLALKLVPACGQPGHRTPIRTATTNGIVMLTFTPLAGMSEVVMGFLPAEMQIHDGA